jgi:hypothetical protein
MTGFAVRAAMSAFLARNDQSWAKRTFQRGAANG